MTDKVEIYLDLAERTFHDGQTGDRYTLEEVKKFFSDESIDVLCTMSIQRLQSFDWDFEKLDAFYREIG